MNEGRVVQAEDGTQDLFSCFQKKQGWCVMLNVLKKGVGAQALISASPVHTFGLVTGVCQTVTLFRGKYR